MMRFGGIGSKPGIGLTYGVALAPMAGVADRAFRVIAKSFGAEYVVSEMISAKGIHYNDKKTPELAALTPDERPAGIQIFGAEPEIMAEAAVRLARDFSPDALDINMGCPVRKITGNGEGSALMKAPALAAKIVRTVRGALDSSPDTAALPLTVKLRTGWDGESVNAPELAVMLEEAGAAALCVHGRTREQFYQPPVDLETIARVKRAVGIPVFGNGGINGAEDALRMLEVTGCDGVMIAQGAYGRPWIFSEVLSALEGKSFKPPELDGIRAVAERHLALLVDCKGVYTGVREARRQIAEYFKSFPGAAGLRAKISLASSAEEIYELISKI